MGKKVIVLSLGGSLIIPNEVNVEYLKKLKSVLTDNKKNYKFVIVCGGGNTARKYIRGLEKLKIAQKFQSLSGISATRMNARFMSYFFDSDQSMGIPHSLKEIEKMLQKKDIIFCGALKYKSNQTSDTTSAEIAYHLKSDFINLTDVNGLYTKNPKEFKDAELIQKISWKEFDKMASKLKFYPGQHFVLDQTASKIIKKHKIKTIILGEKLLELDNLLKGKKFIGTTICD